MGTQLNPYDIGLAQECVQLAETAAKELSCKCGAMVVLFHSFGNYYNVLSRGVTCFEGGYHGKGRRKVCHAEREAIRSVMLEEFDLEKITLYSSLEPCYNPYASGNSCSELIVDSGIKRIVFAYRDPNHKILGAEFLRARGVTTIDLSSRFGEIPEWMLEVMSIDTEKAVNGKWRDRKHVKRKIRTAISRKRKRGFFESDLE